MESKVKVSCPGCGQNFRVQPSILGKKVRCKSCQERFVAKEIETEDLNDDIMSVDLSLDASSSEIPNAPDPPPLGQIGDFQLLEILGSGAFGLVYRALDTKLGRMVAIKVPRFSVDDKSKSRRFLNEAKTAARLRHPNIVALYESGVTSDGQMYLVSEFVEGKTLLQHIRKGSEGLKKIVGWIRDLARALHVAHAEGIVHRDIKSENILVSEADQRPQITDFGLAKIADDNSSIQTQDGSLLGTPAYMSPEQARGEIEDVGPLSDLYSLGVVLFESLSGKRPYRGRPHEVVAAVAGSTSAPQVDDFNSKLPKELVAICAKAMHKQPASRYQTGEEFADDLDRWLNGKPILAKQFTGITSKRNVLIGSSVLACVFVIGVIASFLGNDTTKQNVASAETVAAENSQTDQSEATVETAVVDSREPVAEDEDSTISSATEGMDDDQSLQQDNTLETSQAPLDPQLAERNAVEWILSKKGRGSALLAKQPDGTPAFTVVSASLYGQKLDSGIAALNHLNSLDWLNLGSAELEPSGLDDICKCENLTVLMLHKANIKTSMLSQAGGIEGLQKLLISTDHIDDEWKFLKDFPNLRSLGVSGEILPDFTGLTAPANLTVLEFSDLDTLPADLVQRLQNENENLRIICGKEESRHLVGNTKYLQNARSLQQQHRLSFNGLPLDDTKQDQQAWDGQQPFWFRTVNIKHGTDLSKIPSKPLSRISNHYYIFNASGTLSVDQFMEQISNAHLTIGFIGLNGTDLTDNGLLHLGESCIVSNCDVRETDVTKEGIGAYLRLAPPLVEVSSDFGTFYNFPQPLTETKPEKVPLKDLPLSEITASTNQLANATEPAEANPIQPQMNAAKKWNELEQQLDAAIKANDLQSLLAIYDQLVKDPRPNQEVQRILNKATQAKDQIAKRLAESEEENKAKELTGKAIQKFTKGDEFGAYVLIRGLPDHIRETKIWEQRKETLDQIEALEAKFPLTSQGNFLGTRKSANTADLAETQKTLGEIRQYDREHQFAALRLFVENESVESSLFVDAREGSIWFNANTMGGMEEVDSGGVVIIGTYKDVNTTEVTITGLRHRPVKIQLQMNKGGAYRGALVLKEAKREELGELVVQLQPEPGLEFENVDLSEAHLWVSPMGFYSPKFPIDSNGRFGPMLLYPQPYSLQAVHPTAFTSEPRRRDVNLLPLETTTIDLPVFLPRDVTFEWVYRDGEQGPWQSGQVTIPSGTRSHYFKDWTKAANRFWISLSGWSSNGMQIDWANSEVLKVDPPTWPPAEDFGPFPQRGKPYPREYPLSEGFTMAVWRPGNFQAFLKVSKIEARPQDE